ncbi:MAG: hypothetical protein CVV27_00990 [Candidatus Melainabacteria bacterium HGW-Melainabacteria-1]|nr:MAG: hypothetical protein CVV27_00990 [Candidatus Melainabacteria bacterium HGW-Melainabacteria-1]
MTCIRAGDVTVRIIAQLNDAAPMPLDLILGAGEAESRATVGRYTVIFRAVSPNYTQSDRPLQPSDYTVTLQVQRT